MEEKRTKIFCTIGPSSSSVPMLVSMMRAGMNVARLNFSHGTHPQHKELMRHIRSASKKAGKTVTILQDLQGPKIRVGDLPEPGVKLAKSQKIQFTTSKVAYQPGKAIPVTYASLHKDVKKDHRILLDDGRMEVRVTGVRGRVISGTVTVGGVLTAHKGMNLPDSHVSAPAFTKKDHEDLLFGVENGVDWIALSFVTSAKTVNDVRAIAQKTARAHHLPTPKIMVKIERKKAVDDFLNILEAADGVMLARGDLGVELPPEEVPVLQKEFVEACRLAGKPIVVATHMLDSMAANPRATRAETSDVANAVFDHADAVMLSQETATGKYPDVTVKTMNAIIEAAEASRLDDIGFYQLHQIPDIATSIAQSVHMMAENDQIDLAVASVTHGSVAQMLNVFRPNIPIVIVCPDESSARQVMVRNGIYPIVLSDEPATFVTRAESALRRMKMIQAKTRVAYVTATPAGLVQLTVKGAR